MKKFLLKILLFLCIVTLLDVCFGIAMRHILATTEKGDWGRRSYIVSKAEQDILVFGSSRAIHHFDPEILSDSLQLTCYNCAEDGTGILVHYPRLKKVIERHRPQIVVYEIIPKYDFLVFDNIHSLSQLRAFAEDQVVKDVIVDIDPKESILLISSLYKYNSSFLDILLQRFSPSKGTAADYTYSPLQGVISYEPSEEDNEVEGGNVDELKMKYLTALVDLCQANGIQLFFTASPWYKMKEQDVYEPLIHLCQEKNISFFNHNFDDSFNLNNMYFSDHAHLNEYGAETYTKLIAHEIKTRF